MKYKYKDVKRILRNLADEIMSEYDNSPAYGVRVNLMPQAHNAMSQYEKLDNWGTLSKEQITAAKERRIMHPVGEQFYEYIRELGLNEDDFRESIKIQENEHNKHTEEKTTVIIHEMTPGPERTKPKGIKSIGAPISTKPKDRDAVYYDKLARNMGYNQGHGRTILYHAGIYDKGLLNRPEIEILMPMTASPDQVGNKAVTPYIYGIERCVSENQNFHLAIANQAMLTAFVLREMGYTDSNMAAVKHVLPHNAVAKNRGACPARTLDASILVETSKGRPLTEKEVEIMKEYVPWSVYQQLVLKFFERNEFPGELKRKFIYDMSDYEAYMEDPEGYDYQARKAQKPKKVAPDVEGVVPEEKKLPFEVLDLINELKEIEDRKSHEESKPEDEKRKEEIWKIMEQKIKAKDSLKRPKLVKNDGQDR